MRTTTFPYLSIARDTGVEYGKVIRAAERIEEFGPEAHTLGLNDFELLVAAAVSVERERRKDVNYQLSDRVATGVVRI